MPRPVCVYDANVLYPAQLRDLLMRLAVRGVVRAHWSEDIHGEWTRNVLENHPDLQRTDVRRTRQLMDRAVPDACVEGYWGAPVFSTKVYVRNCAGSRLIGLVLVERLAVVFMVRSCKTIILRALINQGRVSLGEIVAFFYFETEYV